MSRATKSYGRLVIVAPERIGDLVRATPVFAAALSSAAFDPVSILVQPDHLDLFEGSSLAERVHAHADEAALKAQLQGADVALFLCEAAHPARLAQDLGVALRAGEASSSARRHLTHAVVPASLGGRPLAVPAGHRMRDLAGLLGLWPDTLEPRLETSASTRAKVRSVLAGRGVAADAAYVLCEPSLGGAADGWTADRYAKLANALHARHGWATVVRALSASSSPADLDGPGATWTPEDGGLSHVRELCAGASLVVACEGPVRWIASAFDVPCISILGLSRSAAEASPDARGELLLSDERDASPHLSRSRTLGHHPGSHELSLERVLAAVDALLEPARAEEGSPS